MRVGEIPSKLGVARSQLDGLAMGLDRAAIVALLAQGPALGGEDGSLPWHELLRRLPFGFGLRYSAGRRQNAAPFGKGHCRVRIEAERLVDLVRRFGEATIQAVGGGQIDAQSVVAGVEVDSHPHPLGRRWI